MGLNKASNIYSDYGSGSSSGSTSWTSEQDIRWPSFTSHGTMERPTQKSSSYSDLIMGRCTLEDVMRDFHMNGSDTPYNPDEDRIWGKHSELSGMGPSSAYVRQKSWPAPERSPAPRLPPPRPEPMEFTTSTPIFDGLPAPFAPECAMATQFPSPACLTAEQALVLGSLPAPVLHSLLRQLQHEKRAKLFKECRFCKNNGEREAYYRSHALKDGRGRVECPVLRAFRCARCGAAGDHAHTIKYCPLSTNEERIKSAAMMRSVRLASGRRRAPALAPRAAPGPPGPPASPASPLPPLWAALEQKLML